MIGEGDGAPVHIREDVARRCGPTLVIELLWRFEMVREWRMLLAAWRRVSILSSLLGQGAGALLRGVSACLGGIELGRRADAKLTASK